MDWRHVAEGALGCPRIAFDTLTLMIPLWPSLSVKEVRMPHVEEGAQICLLGIYYLRRNLRCPKDYLEQRFRNAQCLRTYPELFSHEVVSVR